MDSIDDLELPEPWSDLREAGSAPRREYIHRELLLELGPGHELSKQPIEVVAAFNRQDEFLLICGDVYVIAHPTWASRRDSFVRLRTFGSREAVQAEIHDMAEYW